MAGKIHTQQFTTAQSLYTLYETLPNEVQEIFLQELFTKQSKKIKTSLCLAYKKAEKENGFLTDEQSYFQDLFGLLTASESASAEDMQKAVLQRAKEEFNDCS
jgi:hypothetical protein